MILKNVCNELLKSIKGYDYNQTFRNKLNFGTK